MIAFIRRLFARRKPEPIYVPLFPAPQAPASPEDDVQRRITAVMTAQKELHASIVALAPLLKRRHHDMAVKIAQGFKPSRELMAATCAAIDPGAKRIVHRPKPPPSPVTIPKVAAPPQPKPEIRQRIIRTRQRQPN